jgi:hypothetical protein
MVAMRTIHEVRQGVCSMRKSIGAGPKALTALGALVLSLASCARGATSVPTENEIKFRGVETPDATEATEYTWAQLLSRDAILPIYDPEFVTADEAPYSDDELVMGVVVGEDAKAYPIGPLNHREIVNDELGGIPILVTF